jgi:hypothetical protein
VEIDNDSTKRSPVPVQRKSVDGIVQKIILECKQ